MKKKNLLKKLGSISLIISIISALFYHSPLKAEQVVFTAWSKVNDVFVNSLGDEIPGAVLKGIDVSYHNKDIDWEAVKASDIDYAILRCGYGQDYESQDDVKWEEYANACTELGIPFGTYLYSYATTVSAAKSEAEHVLRVIEGYKLTYPIYYDMEDAKQAGTSEKRKAQMAEAFCSVIEDAGYQVGIYANTDWFTNKLTDPYFETRDKWVAQYNATCKYTGNYRMWQCTSSGSVPGISTKVDLNFWFEQAPVYQGNTPSSINENPGNNQIIQPGDTIGSENPPTNDNPGNNEGTENIPGNNNQAGTDNLPGNNQGTENPPANNDNQSIDKNPGNSQGTEDLPENNQGTNNDSNNNQNTTTKPEDAPKKLIISQDFLELSYGGTSVLTANQPVTWFSDDEEVIEIDSQGKVSPIGVGEAIITAETSSGETAECQVIIKKPIKDTIVEEIPAQQFTGSQIRPSIVIMDKDKELEKGTDYKISYTNNMGKGTAVITIKGKGYYTGSTKVTFQIVPKEKLPVPVVTSLSSKKSVVTLKWKKVTKASGYEVYRAIGKNGTYTLQKTITKKSKVTYKDKKLIKGKKYYYKIRSYKLTDESKQYSTYTKVNIKV